MASADTKVETKPAEEKVEEPKTEEGDKKPRADSAISADGKKKDKKPRGDSKGSSKGFSKGRSRAPSGPTACGNGYRLNVKNLPPEMETAQLKELFVAFGSVADAQIKLKDNGKSLGVGFVVFENEEEGKKAQAAMHDKEMGGKNLNVQPAERREEPAQAPWMQYADMGKGKGKGKGKEMEQYMMAMQQAYMQAYGQYMQNQNKPNEECDIPGTYNGSLQKKNRYGHKSWIAKCDETMQFLHADVLFDDKEDAFKDAFGEKPEEGTKVTFKVVAMYKPWEWSDKLQNYQQLPAKGYPKAKDYRKA